MNLVLDFKSCNDFVWLWDPKPFNIHDICSRNLIYKFLNLIRFLDKYEMSQYSCGCLWDASWEQNTILTTDYRTSN